MIALTSSKPFIMLRNWTFHFEIQNDRNQTPLYEQIAGELERLIETGVLQQDTVLPGSRKMAEQLGVNRKTVMRALELLVEKDLLKVEERRGMVVCGGQEVCVGDSPLPDKLEDRQGSELPIVIDGGTPDTELLPFLEFSRAYRYYFNLYSRRHMLGYRDAQGFEPFRMAVAEMLNHARGMQASAKRVCLTRGSQMALFLISHTQFRPGDAIAVENPGYHWAMKIFEEAGLRLVQIAVDKEGMVVDDLLRAVQNDPGIRAVYVTPRYQYPTTVTMSSKRRKQLVDVVQQHSICVIEDDFGSDFRFGQHYYRPLCCQMSMNRFFYVSTFSKMFAPAVRMGYIVAGEEQIAALTQLRRLIDMQGDVVMEHALLELIENGEMKRYLKRSLAVYQNRMDLMCRLIETYLKDRVEFVRPNGGLAVWVMFPHLDMEVDEFRKLLNNKKIEIRHVHKNAQGKLGIRIGYASLSPAQMETFIARMSSLLAECL